MIKKRVFIAVLSIASMFGLNLFAQEFTEQTSISITGAEYSFVAWGDYNSDGYLDFIITGNSAEGPISKIYKNNGNNSFTEQSEILIQGVYYGCAAWGDYNNDGNLDLVISGYTGFYGISKIYKNNGDNSFAEQTNISIIGLKRSSAAWSDYDKDGNLDLFLCGSQQEGLVSKIYKNNGNNSFTEQTDFEIDGVDRGSISWADCDSDDDMDFLLTGFTGSSGISEIYQNTFGKGFKMISGLNREGVFWSNAVWGDYDNDLDVDILLSGYTVKGGITKIYQNNGDGSFNDLKDSTILGVFDGSAAWGDYNNDGFLDFLLNGWSVKLGWVTQIYKNIGSDKFEEQKQIYITGIEKGNAAWGDYDNDGDLDILLAGESKSGPVAKIYKNNSVASNQKPNVITNLQHFINGNDVAFLWDMGSDPNQKAGLNYNLYIYDTDKNSYPNPSHTITKNKQLNGKRLVAQIGNIQRNSHRMVLPKGNYTWSVQAIDASFVGGSFAPEQSFSVEETLSVEKLHQLGIKIYPNPVKNYLNIDFQINQIQEVTVSDLKGKTIIHKTNIRMYENIDFSKIESGIYFLTIQCSKGIIITKIIKE